MKSIRIRGCGSEYERRLPHTMRGTAEPFSCLHNIDDEELCYLHSRLPTDTSQSGTLWSSESVFFVGRLLLVRFSLAGTFILLYLCNAFVVLVTGVDRMYDNNNTRYDRCHRTEWHADRRGQNTRYPWAYPSKRKYVALATYNNGEHTDDGRARATNGQGDGGLGRCT